MKNKEFEREFLNMDWQEQNEVLNELMKIAWGD